MSDIVERLIDQLKKELLDLARSGASRPADDSVYGIALALFTTPSLSKAHEINLSEKLEDALWKDLGAKFFNQDQMPQIGSAYDLALEMFAERLEQSAS